MRCGPFPTAIHGCAAALAGGVGHRRRHIPSALSFPSFGVSISVAWPSPHRVSPSVRWSGMVAFGSAASGTERREAALCGTGRGRYGRREGEDEEMRQAKEQAAARRRWEALIREQKIKTLTPREAGYTFKLTDKALLDVRPSNERQKAWVKGSTWIPVFDLDTSADLGGLSKEFTNFVMGGWWSGISTLSLNKNFTQQVEEKFSKDTDIILVCQKGLR